MLAELLQTEPSFMISLIDNEKAIIDSEEFKKIRRLALEKSLSRDKLYIRFLANIDKNQLKERFLGWDDGFLSAYKQKVSARSNGIKMDYCINHRYYSLSSVSLAEFIQRYKGFLSKESIESFVRSSNLQSWAAGRRVGYCGLVCIERKFCRIGNNYSIEDYMNEEPVFLG